MTDITPIHAASHDAFDGSRSFSSLPPADAAASSALSLPLPPPKLLPSRASDPCPEPQPVSPSASGPLLRGAVRINAAALRALREARCLSQQELVYDFERGNVQISIATIKRAETGHHVRFRICRELARYFGVSSDYLLR
jgi:hypothetical protein